MLLSHGCTIDSRFKISLNMVSFPDNSNFSTFAILAPRNEHCDEINGKGSDLILGELKTYMNVNALIIEEEWTVAVSHRIFK